MQVKSIAECSKGSTLQCFLPSLSYQLSFRSLFCLFLSGHFTQVLLYYNYCRYALITKSEHRPCSFNPQGRSQRLYHAEADQKKKEISDQVTLLFRWRIIKALIRLHRCAGWSASLLFARNKVKVSLSSI